MSDLGKKKDDPPLNEEKQPVVENGHRTKDDAGCEHKRDNPHTLPPHPKSSEKMTAEKGPFDMNLDTSEFIFPKSQQIDTERTVLPVFKKLETLNVCKNSDAQDIKNAPLNSSRQTDLPMPADFQLPKIIENYRRGSEETCLVKRPRLQLIDSKSLAHMPRVSRALPRRLFNDPPGLSKYALRDAIVCALDAIGNYTFDLYQNLEAEKKTIQQIIKDNQLDAKFETIRTYVQKAHSVKIIDHLIFLLKKLANNYIHIANSPKPSPKCHRDIVLSIWCSSKLVGSIPALEKLLGEFTRKYGINFMGLVVADNRVDSESRIPSELYVPTKQLTEEYIKRFINIEMSNYASREELEAAEEEELIYQIKHRGHSELAQQIEKVDRVPELALLNCLKHDENATEYEREKKRQARDAHFEKISESLEEELNVEIRRLSIEGQLILSLQCYEIGLAKLLVMVESSCKKAKTEIVLNKANFGKTVWLGNVLMKNECQVEAILHLQHLVDKIKTKLREFGEGDSCKDKLDLLQNAIADLIYFGQKITTENEFVSYISAIYGEKFILKITNHKWLVSPIILTVLEQKQMPLQLVTE